MGVTYIRLVGTVLCELNDDWAIVRRYMTIAPQRGGDRDPRAQGPNDLA